MLASLPVLTLVAVMFGRRTRKLAREAQDLLAETASVVEETLHPRPAYVVPYIRTPNRKMKRHIQGDRGASPRCFSVEKAVFLG